jgi:phosphoribosylformimino-5-aminoimidazole carboxamide ribotide isomerase
MELIPAIDLLDGKVVRLERGRFDAVTVYADDAASEAERFAREGARRIHVVDLEGARSGASAQAAIVEQIVRRAGIPVQIGGGVRDAATAERWLALGADRVVLGTASVRAPEMVEDLCRRFPGKIVIAIDARRSERGIAEVAIEGWVEGSGVAADALAARVDRWGAAAILYTDIDRDGMRGGPAVEATAALQRAVAATVIASGGIGTLDDLRALARAGVRAAVCGRALYAGAFTLGDALSALAEIG